MGIPLILVLGKYNSDRYVTDAHADSAGNHRGFSTELVDVKNCWDRRQEQENADHARRQQARGVT